MPYSAQQKFFRILVKCLSQRVVVKNKHSHLQLQAHALAHQVVLNGFCGDRI